MDLEFMTYDEYKIINNNISRVELCPKVLIIDISVGWTDTKYINLFEKIINNKDNTKIYFRLVDQFRYQWTSEIYEWVTKISNTKGIKIIKTYDCDYNGLNSLVK
jgi:hypothetical protein